MGTRSGILQLDAAINLSLEFIGSSSAFLQIVANTLDFNATYQTARFDQGLDTNGIFRTSHVVIGSGPRRLTVSVLAKDFHSFKVAANHDRNYTMRATVYIGKQADIEQGQDSLLFLYSPHVY
jgi:hypothetical protein